jgi:CRISPR system Cascade subunit CasD
VKVLVLRFDAPLMSFGSPVVDQNGFVQPFPALSMLTGLLANALGWDHRDVEKLELLQERLRFASRLDRVGYPLRDYQTVDLGQDWMLPEKWGWTTRGRIATRAGASSDMTHQRYRDYRADSLCTVALTLVGEASPSIDEVTQALREPMRPLFIGRKCCLPAAPILVDVIEGISLVSVLASTPRGPRADRGLLRASWWEGDARDGAVGESGIVPVTDERDWRNRVHVGRRLMRKGHVDPPERSRA